MVQDRDGNRYSLTPRANGALFLTMFSVLAGALGMLWTAIEIHNWIYDRGVADERRYEESMESRAYRLQLDERINRLETEQARRAGLPIPPDPAPPRHRR